MDLDDKDTGRREVKEIRSVRTHVVRQRKSRGREMRDIYYFKQRKKY
jgi:hypothetical protein